MPDRKSKRKAMDVDYTRTCVVCGKLLFEKKKQITTQDNRKIYCSQQCRGKDLRKGHKIIGGVECKYCGTCKKWYSLSRFSKGGEWDGLANRCKGCLSVIRKARSKELKESLSIKPYSQSQLFNKIYSNYIWSSNKRNYDFLISESEFKLLIKQDCYYCGARPMVKAYRYHDKVGEYAANGIDRVDNDKGYIIGNCVPCCEVCNKMKWKLDKNVFYEQIEKIYFNLLNPVYND